MIKLLAAVIVFLVACDSPAPQRLALLEGGCMCPCTCSPDASSAVAADASSDATSIDAPTDAFPDASPDAAPPDAATGISLAAPWVRHEVHRSATLLGADGVDVATIDGELAVATPWEQSGKVTVSTRAAGVWSTRLLPGTVVSPEEAKFCDLDGDGALDVIAGGEGRTVAMWYGPGWSAMTLIAAATNVQRWTPLVCGELDGQRVIWAGGRQYPAHVGFLASSTPRNGSSWTWTPIGPTGWTISIVPIATATGLRLYLSDRYRIDSTPRDWSLMGSRYLERGAGGAWASHAIHRASGEGEPEMLSVVGDGRVLDTLSDATHNVATIRTSSDGGATWASEAIPQPAGVGQLMDVHEADVDADGLLDVVCTYHDAPGALSGVAWLRRTPSGWERGEISGPDGTKFDNAILLDLDGDGDLDVLTSEQESNFALAGVALGVVWYENPRLAP